MGHGSTALIGESRRAVIVLSKILLELKFRAGSGAGGRKPGYCRTTVTARHPELPAASKARTVTIFVPTSSGTLADQFAVPDASPELPTEVLQLTAVTPALSLATPLNTMLADCVETIVEPGERMVSDGGVVSGAVPVGPVDPVGPVVPVAPVGPVDPVGPPVPVDPVEPAGPVAPVEPVGPAGAVGPVGACVEAAPYSD